MTRAFDSTAAAALLACAGACQPASTPASSGVDVLSSIDASPAAVTWTAAAPCPVARFEAMGAPLPDGRVLVMGGFVSADLAVTQRVDLYDPTTDRWSERAALPGPPTHAGVATDGAHVFLVGGLAGSLSQSVTDVWIYDSSADAWTAGPPLPVGQSALVLARIDRTLHAVGGLAPDGNSDTGAHVVLSLDDLSAGTGAWSEAPPLPNPRNHLGGTVWGGMLFVVGGRHGWDEQGGHDSVVHAFDPAAGTWSARAPIPIARSEIAAAVAPTALGLVVIGGSTAGVHPTASVVFYDAAADVWTEAAPLPEPRKGAVVVRTGNRLLVTTGSPTSTDPSAATWLGCCVE